MVKYCSKVPNESIIDITGVVTKPKEAVAGCTQKTEIVVKQFWIINKSAPILPFQLDDASRVVLNQEEESGFGAAAKEEEKKGEKFPVVKQDIRLNNRIIDLRVPTNQAIFRL